eukprot:3249086-Pleurochrysis_carterae.AAC.1
MLRGDLLRRSPEQQRFVLPRRDDRARWLLRPPPSRSPLENLALEQKRRAVRKQRLHDMCCPTIAHDDQC